MSAQSPLAHGSRSFGSHLPPPQPQPPRSRSHRRSRASASASSSDSRAKGRRSASELELDQVSSLERVGFDDGVRKLGERAGTAFYVGRSRSGTFCFATGPAGGPRPEFGVLACQGAESGFPSERMPIADLSPLRGHGGSNEVSVWKLVGFAADGVAAVAVRDTTGVLHSTPVSGNVYASDELLLAATEIVALDSAGSILFEKSLESSTPG